MKAIFCMFARAGLASPGAQAQAGASLRVDKRTTLDAEAARHGNALKKLPLSPDGIKATLNMGF